MASKLIVPTTIALISSLLLVSCNNRGDITADSMGEYVVNCVLTDTTIVQRMRLMIKEPGKTKLTTVPADFVSTAYITSGKDNYYFKYEDKGIWTTIMNPEDGANYSLTIFLKNNKSIIAGTEYPKRPDIIGDAALFRKAYYPATDDIVDNVYWITPETSLDNFHFPSFIWMFLGQPKGDGSLRYSDLVATKSTNRLADSFNTSSKDVWSLPCWSNENIGKVGWKTDLGYPVRSYDYAVRLHSPVRESLPDVLSYDLIGDYDVDYAMKHKPSAEYGYGYNDPLMVIDVRLVSSSYDRWLKGALYDESLHDVLHSEKAYSDIDFFGTAIGVFGAESVLRFPLGSKQRELTKPTKYNNL